MKKLMILFALVLGSTLTYAQQGYNSGAQGNRGYNQSNRGQVTYNNGHRGGNAYRGQNGYQNRTTTRTTTRHYQGRGNGVSYQGGVTNYNRPQTRVRWRNSACGTYRIRLTQERRYTAGYWSYDRGCRRWVEPCYTWHNVCSDRVYPNRGW